jgi:hypothetical protein
VAAPSAGMRWLLGCGSLFALALLLFVVPASLEGPLLIPISPGHGLSLVDVVALVPLLAGVGLLAGGLWQRRQRLDAALSRRPRLAWAGAFVGGLGLGLLVASVFIFFWWWVIGAALLTATLLAAALVAAGRDGVRARSRGSDGTSGWVRWLWSANPVAKATSAIAVPAASRCLASRSRSWRR